MNKHSKIAGALDDTPDGDPNATLAEQLGFLKDELYDLTRSHLVVQLYQMGVRTDFCLTQRLDPRTPMP